MKKKVLIIGPVPPPAGGVSIHINRLAHILKPYFEIRLIDESRIPKPGILNIRKFNVFGYLRALGSSQIVHIHSGTRSLKYLHIIVSRLLGKKTVLTIHSLKKGSSAFKTRLDGWIYSLPHLTIMVTGDFRDRIRLTNKTLVKEAFLPPVFEGEPALPEAMAAWVDEKKKLGFHVAVANAWRLDTFKGEDLYGLDLCINAVQRFKKEGRRICLVYVVSDLGGQLDIETYQKQIEELDLTDVFYLQKSQISFVNLVQMSDIVLRPTNTDGDALTVREALYLGKSVIASDVVQRPVGTALFKTRDAGSLAEAIKDQASLTTKKAGLNGHGQTDYGKFYQEIYSKLN